MIFDIYLGDPSLLAIWVSNFFIIIKNTFVYLLDTVMLIAGLSLYKNYLEVEWPAEWLTHFVDDV